MLNFTLRLWEAGNIFVSSRHKVLMDVSLRLELLAMFDSHIDTLLQQFVGTWQIVRFRIISGLQNTSSSSTVKRLIDKFESTVW